MYKVGQVLFIILNKKQQVVPVQVTEQVVRRSLNGEDTTYSVAIPGREGTKVLSLEQIDGDVYESIEDVRKQMFEHASQVINTISDKALSVAKNRFKYDLSSPGVDIGEFISASHEDIEISKNPSDSEPAATTMKVDLGDGKVGNISIPDLERIK